MSDEYVSWLKDRIKTLESELLACPTRGQMKDLQEENARLEHRFVVACRRNEILNRRLREQGGK